MLATLPIVLALTAPASASDLEPKVKEIFEEHCTTCHDSGSDEVDLEQSLAELARQSSKETQKPYVVPGKPEESYLFAKMTGKGAIEGEVMPLGDDPLPEEKLSVVRDWITALAPAGGGDAGAGGGTDPGGGDPAAGGGADTAKLEADLAAANEKAANAEKGVAEFFDDNCTVCHDEGTDEVVLEGPLGRLANEKSKYTQKPFIVPGDVDGSYLWAKLLGKGIEGDPMPQGEDPLPADKIEPVKAWIMALGEVETAKAALAAAGSGTGDGGTEGPGDGGTGVSTGPEETCKKRKKNGECKKERKRTSDPPFRDMFFVNLPTTAGLGKNSIQFRITHHFGRIGTERGAFGLDAGAVMSLGVAYGIIDGLDLVLRRSNSRKGYELGVKYIPIQQEYGMPVSFGAYGSIEYYRAFSDNIANPVTGNLQAMVSRLLFERWTLMLALGYHFRTNHSASVAFDLPDDDIDGPVPVTDTRNTMTVALATSIRLGKKKYHTIDIEYVFPIQHQVFYWNGALEDRLNAGGWSIGWGAITASKKHAFKVFLSNTREIHTNLYAPGGNSNNPFPSGVKYPFDFFLGFTISRRWSL